MLREGAPHKIKKLCTPLPCGVNEQMKRLADIRSWIPTILQFVFKGQLGQVENTPCRQDR